MNSKVEERLVEDGLDFAETYVAVLHNQFPDEFPDYVQGIKAFTEKEIRDYAERLNKKRYIEAKSA